MANINAPEVEYFESFANEIQSKFQRVKKLVSQTVASGDYHEEVIRTIIRNFLSKRYSVKKGFIYAGQGKVSNQIDVMIIDETAAAAYLFQEGDFAIVIPDAVIAIMEVKTTLDVKQFDIAVDNIASAKALVELPATLMSIIFGYQGSKPSDKTLHAWFTRPRPSYYKDKYILGPHAIMFFTEGCLLARFTEDGDWNYGGKYYHKMFRDNPERDVGWQLSIILAMIISACEQNEFRHVHQFFRSKADNLIQAEGSSISHSRFSLGEGLSTK